MTNQPDRVFTSHSLIDLHKFKLQLLNFGTGFSNFCFLDSHGYDFNKSFDCIAAAGCIKSISGAESSLSQLNDFRKSNPDWTFGHISYDLKNEIEPILQSSHFDGIGFEKYFFFVPELVFILSENKVKIGSFDDQNEELFRQICAIKTIDYFPSTSADFVPRIHREKYIETVQEIQQHIAKGDCYEVCFCQEFFAENIFISPLKAFEKLNEISPNPFSAFYKCDSNYLLCASPERFLKKSGNNLISQPIKGTTKRTKLSAGHDYEEIKSLFHNKKERAENTMIVDLVRNDLSKICKEGTVKVKEFLGIYSFPHVHQMISTIAGELDENTGVGEILQATFPMGSMTGAPKIRAMELIEEYEQTKRGLYSGSVGYFTPDGDFDFNVIIRSILYNSDKKYASIQAGSAITFYSEADKEYEECLLKIDAIRKAME